MFNNTRFGVAWFPPPGLNHCGICGEECRASWIEDTPISAVEGDVVIAPLCVDHAHFAAEALSGIREVFQFSGILPTE